MYILLAFLFLCSILNSVLYYTELWQCKEYRFDRFLDGMKMKSGFKRAFAFFHMIKLLIIVVGGLYSYHVGDVLPLLYAFIGAMTFEFFELIYRWRKGLPVAPKMTKKAVLIVTTSMLFSLGIAMGIAECLSVESGQYFDVLLIGFAIVAVFAPDINALVVLLIEPISAREKTRIIQRARQYMGSLENLTVIGVTGSYGKSSTKEFLYHILSKKYDVFKTPGNTNVDIGIAREVLRRLKRHHDVAIIEMGAYKPGEIRKSAALARPTIGVITAIAGQHLALYKTIDNIKRAKYELIDSLPMDGLAMFNADNSGATELAKKAKSEGRKVLTYAVNGKANLMALHVVVEPEKISFDIHGVPFEVELYGRQNLPNVLAAIGIARECGMTLKEISKAVRDIRPPSKVMNLLKSKSRGDKLVAVDDSYNANPDGVVAALDYLEMFKGYKKIVVFPGMLELGPKTDSEHIRVGERLGQVADHIVFTSSDFLNPLLIGLGKDFKNYSISESAQETLEQLKELCPADSDEKYVILFEQRGSQSAMEEMLK